MSYRMGYMLFVVILGKFGTVHLIVISKAFHYRASCRQQRWWWRNNLASEIPFSL